MSNEKVIKLISANFVPVAANRYNYAEAKTPAGDLFRAIMKQRPTQYQGILLVSPDGKVLAAHQNFKDEKTWPLEVRTALEEGLRTFGPVTPRKAERVELNPWRGVGVRPDGSVELAVVVRQMIQGRTNGLGAYDNITLDAKSLAAFAPKEAKPGSKWDLPDDVAKRFSRCLSSTSDQSTMPKPDEVTACEFHAMVQSVENDIATIAYRGQLAATHKEPFKPGKIDYAAANFRGFGTYDVKKGQLLSLTILSDGNYRLFPPYDKELSFNSGGVEWRREKPRAK